MNVKGINLLILHNTNVTFPIPPFWIQLTNQRQHCKRTRKSYTNSLSIFGARSFLTNTVYIIRSRNYFNNSTFPLQVLIFRQIPERHSLIASNLSKTSMITLDNKVPKYHISSYICAILDTTFLGRIKTSSTPTLSPIFHWID